MMDITDLTDQQKSVMLAKAMGKYENVPLLQVVDALVDGVRKHYWLHNGVVEEIPNLYEVDENGDPLYMPLAWRVLNWGIEHPWNNVPGYTITGNVAILRLFENARMIKMSPADAGRRWLDKILELSLEEGRYRE